MLIGMIVYNYTYTNSAINIIDGSILLYDGFIKPIQLLSLSYHHQLHLYRYLSINYYEVMFVKSS